VNVAPQQTTGTEKLGPVLIIGTGLIGASIGLALREAGEEVYLLDRVRSHALVAASLGAGVIDEPESEEIRLVVVATPPDAICDVVAAALQCHPNAVVTDVASVKKPLRDKLAARGVQTDRYVGSHPMAGSQHAGPITAVAGLFIDRTWVVAVDGDARTAARHTVVRLAETCGARVVEMDAADHDEAVAQMSHLPHLMSILTAGHLRDVPQHNLQLAGQGVRDVTRIAGSDPSLWRQILSANSAAVRRELDGVRTDLEELMAVLEQPARLEQFLARGRRGARSLPGKHGARSLEFESVVVEIPDEPGALARLFGDINAAGVNVEDLSIEHDQSRQVGFLSVQVTAAQACELRRAMVESGWALRA